MAIIRRKSKTIYFDVRDSGSADALAYVADSLTGHGLEVVIQQSPSDYPAWSRIARTDPDFVVQFQVNHNTKNIAEVLINRVKKDTTGTIERDTKKSTTAAELIKHYLETSELSISSIRAAKVSYEETKRMGWFISSEVPYLTINLNCDGDILEDALDAFSESIVDYFGR